MSLRNDITLTKQNGVVYTPAWIIKLILDKTFGRQSLAAKKICDPSCGDGAFLLKVAERIIKEANIKNKRKLGSILESSIHGFDIDGEALSLCRQNLDCLARANGINRKLEWKIFHQDSLDVKTMRQYENFFDYVVGNPPYIRVQHLGKRRRDYIFNHWRLAGHGCSDIYLAFFELGLKLLNNKGSLGFITPNTYAKTDSGYPLRERLSNNKLIKCLIDFGQHKVFDGFSTYTMITILAKEKQNKSFALYRYDGKKVNSEGKVNVELLNGDKWVLHNEATLRRIKRIESFTPLSALAEINVGVQTLADDVFIMEMLAESGEMLKCLTLNKEEVEIEKAITKPIIKVSVAKNGRDPKNRIIIFPYKNDRRQGRLFGPNEEQEHYVLMDEDEIKQNYKSAYAFLLSKKERLLERDKGSFNPDKWYAFGRHMDFAKTFGHKILTSGMNQKPNFFVCPRPDATFYSGYSIRPHKIPLEVMLGKLNSKEMEFYINHVSRDYQSGWKSYAKAFIKDFSIDLRGLGTVGNYTGKHPRLVG